MHLIAPAGPMGCDIAVGAFPECHAPSRGFQRLLAQRPLVIQGINAVEENFPIFQPLFPRFCQIHEGARAQPNMPAATFAAVLPLVAEYPTTALVACDLKVDPVTHSVTS